MKRLRWSELHRLTRALLLLALADFLAYAIFSVAIGGDAADGVVREGRYFVSNHGALTEVGRGVWVLNRAQGYSLFALWPGPPPSSPRHKH